MVQPETSPAPHPSRAEVLFFGFSTALAMWAIGYIGRLPSIDAPPFVLAVLMLLVLLSGGFATGRLGTGGWRAGLHAGGVSALLNLLILGSLLAEEGAQEVPSALIYIPCFILASMGLGALGAILGSRGAHPARRDFDAAFAWTAACATLLLLAAGGLVTSYVAGMAVPDWPSSFQYNMFLYPLSRMTGGIYFEHTHRLLGSLVGLTTLALALHLSFTPHPRALKGLSWLAFACVTFQGVLGGLRVTENSLKLATFHGILGQTVFALIVALAVLLTPGFRLGAGAKRVPGAATDLMVTTWLIPLVLLQISLGALVRHFHWGLHLHIAMAVVVLFAGLVAGVRAWGMHPELRPLARAGMDLVQVLGVQFVLGFAAWVATGAAGEETPLYMTLIATAHQTVGALVLASAVRLMLWSWRLLAPRVSGGEATTAPAATAG